MYTTLDKKDNGFTLIEMAIVIIIVGFMSIPMILIYQTQKIHEKVSVTQEHIEFISTQISNFVAPEGRYPCPADRSLPVTDPNFGLEVCNPLGLVVGACTANNGICMVAGAGADNDGDMAPDPVLIGAVPIRSLRDTNIPTGYATFVPDKSAQDGWGNKLTYAVSATMTNLATYNQKWGVIDAVNENYEPTANVNQDAHYVLVSHGPDGKGAFSPGGTIHRNCGTITKVLGPPLVITTTSRDNENCNDQDATFMQGLSMYQTTGLAHFDDTVFFVKSRNSSPWQYITTAMGVTENIRNTNTDNVGILNTTPTEKLDVSGTIRVDNNVLVPQICDTAGNDCFDVNKIAGTGMQCPAGQVVKSIANNNLVCVIPVFLGINPTNCSPGYVRGIRTDGSVICTP